MDAYEATRIVFSRIQTLDPDNAAKIMGLLLIQDHGEKEMIRLAFGPETLLHSVILKARKELGLLLPPPPPSPPSLSPSSSPFANHLHHHHHLSRQNSSTSSRFGFAHHPPPPLNISSPSWAPPDQLSEDLLNPVNNSSPYYNNNGGGGGGDLVEEMSIQDQLSFLNDPLYQEMSGGGGWPHSHRRSGSVADLCLGSEVAGASGFGWKPCLYFARGYCKNGTSCRFLHGLPNEELGSPMSKSDFGMEQHCQEQQQLLRSKSQRLSAAAAGAFPYSPTGSMTMPLSPSSSKCMSFLLQQQNDSQRVAAAAAAALMLGDEGHKFIGGRSRLDMAEFAGMMNPGSRQIYLTFPADSTFREEDVSNYFSIYGPVQDVRIPYQQKRMFGFVTFVYPETVKLILAKGNPHFVCDARVLVKPYKEKGKVPDKYRKQQQGERGDFSGCTTPTGLDSRDPYDLQQLGARMLYNSNSISQEMLLRRKMEEQQQAAELKQAIELQGRRFMGLQLLDFKARSLSSPSPHVIINPSNEYSREESSPEDKSPSPASSGGEQQINSVNVSAAADKEESARETSPNEDSDFQESGEHNLPDSPFASPTKASAFGGDLFAVSAQADVETLGNGNHLMTPTLLPPTSSLDMASFKSCLFQMPRFSSGHGAVGL